MSKATVRIWKLPALGLFLPALLVLLLASGDRYTPVSEASANTTYSGQATVVQATVLGLRPVRLSDTGALPSEGGAEEASLLEAEVPSLLAAQVLHAATIGQGNYSRSEASVNNLDLTVGGNTIAAGLLMARAEANCQGGDASVDDSSEVASLIINGVEVTVSGEPNQTVGLPNGRVIINERQEFQDGNFGDITVSALHVIVYGIADVVVSSAHAGITCAAPPPAAKDFVTGGGWITGTPSGAKVNFGVAGGIKKQGNLWGHLTYIDHGSGMKVKGTGVTAYEVVDATTRLIRGTAKINGQDGFTYEVIVADNGEPGRGDTFGITLSNGYSASGSLGGGNIQLHQ
jgi:hypothetical protein